MRLDPRDYSTLTQLFRLYTNYIMEDTLKNREVRFELYYVIGTSTVRWAGFSNPRSDHATPLGDRDRCAGVEQQPEARFLPRTSKDGYQAGGFNICEGRFTRN